MNSLDFMIVGAQKSGTTAMAQFLSEHPAICMASPKEPHLFDAPAYNKQWNPENFHEFYAPFFKHYKGEVVSGEATPIYLFWPEVAAELYRYNPQLKLIILLRDPVDRAISHYAMERDKGIENLPILPALMLEPLRLWRDKNNRAKGSARRWASYISRGKYSRQLGNLLQFFPLEQLLLIDSNELKNNHNRVLRRIFHFLGVNDAIKIPPERVFNRAYQRFRFARLVLGLLFVREKRSLKYLLNHWGVDIDSFKWISKF